MTTEKQIEQSLIAKLRDLKYTYRDDIDDRTSLVQNFRKKFEALNKVKLQGFVDSIIQRMIFDGEVLSDLLAPLELNWKDRLKKELALMEDLTPLLHKLAQGKEISGLRAYE